MQQGMLEISTTFDNSEVLNPSFELSHGIDHGVQYRDLYLQTYQRGAGDSNVWVAQPREQWHRLARMYPDRILTYPVFTNPHAQRYLNPKHGRLTSVIFHREEDEPLPETADAAVSEIDLALPWKCFSVCTYGLGLSPDLDEVWRSLSGIPAITAIGVTNAAMSTITESIAWITVSDLNRFRRSFERFKRLSRERVQLARRWDVRNNLLATLDPERFPYMAPAAAAAPLLEYVRTRASRANTGERAQRQAAVRAVRQELATLATEAPAEILQLHAEIERVTLSTMIERFASMLEQSQSEARWQQFFENNVLVLSLVFSRPVRLLHTQFHAQTSRLDGTGAQIGDFLFAEQGQALAIVEIKKPSSALLQATPYRNREVFGPHSELSGAVTQVLYQRSAIRSNWLVHRTEAALRDSQPDAIKCIVVAGTMPDDEAQKRSFELFRNACKDVEIVTFDELLGKLQLLLQHLTPRNGTTNDTVPF
jgi:hypothetical protein